MRMVWRTSSLIKDGFGYDSEACAPLFPVPVDNNCLVYRQKREARQAARVSLILPLQWTLLISTNLQWWKIKDNIVDIIINREKYEGSQLKILFRICSHNHKSFSRLTRLCAFCHNNHTRWELIERLAFRNEVLLVENEIVPLSPTVSCSCCNL